LEEFKAGQELGLVEEIGTVNLWKKVDFPNSCHWQVLYAIYAGTSYRTVVLVYIEITTSALRSGTRVKRKRQ
jgi:hypothetical protein